MEGADLELYGIWDKERQGFVEDFFYESVEEAKASPLLETLNDTWQARMRYAGTRAYVARRWVR